MTSRELAVARWLADKVTSESRHTREVLREVTEMGFEPETGSFIIEARVSDGDGNHRPVRFRFRPEVIPATE